MAQNAGKFWRKLQVENGANCRIVDTNVHFPYTWGMENSKKRKYRPRIVDALLKRDMRTFGGVLIAGPKMCGKTWTGQQQASSSVYLDDEDNLQKALLAPEVVLAGDNPRLIDEWQTAPLLWDKARRFIDREQRPGLFIFTGSAVPPAAKPRHSGTGRFTRLAMRPMTLFESGDSSGIISLKKLFNGEKIKPCASQMNFQKVVRLICRGGWPAGLWLNEDDAMRLPQGYLRMVIESDVSRVDGVNRNPAKVELLLRSLARNSATTAGPSSILSDLRFHEQNETLSADSVESYLNALKQIFVIEDQEAWLPALRSKTRIRSSPKRHFVDPSLAAASLGATPEALADEPKTAGFLFESLCHRDLSVYTEALGGKVYHYRDEKGLEADAILQLPGGAWAAVEVKLGTFQFDEAAENLLKLKKKMEAQEVRPPAFLMILTASGGLAHTRDDGVHVVPVDCLGP
jgi:predicted AAA+ superfamily ATPase